MLSYLITKNSEKLHQVGVQINSTLTMYNTDNKKTGEKYDNRRKIFIITLIISIMPLSLCN